MSKRTQGRIHYISIISKGPYITVLLLINHIAFSVNTFNFQTVHYILHVANYFIINSTKSYLKLNNKVKESLMSLKDQRLDMFVNHSDLQL